MRFKEIDQNMDDLKDLDMGGAYLFPKEYDAL